MKIEKCKLQVVDHLECDKVVFTVFLSFIVLSRYSVALFYSRQDFSLWT